MRDYSAKMCRIEQRMQRKTNKRKQNLLQYRFGAHTTVYENRWSVRVAHRHIIDGKQQCVSQFFFLIEIKMLSLRREMKERKKKRS